MSNGRVSDTNISFSSLKNAYVLKGQRKALNNSELRDGNTGTAISLSYFRNSEFLDNTNIPGGSSLISLNSHFKGKKFRAKTYTTNEFHFDSNFSGESDRLHPISSLSSSSALTSGQSKHGRLSHSNVTHNYPSMLLCPQNGDPTIDLEDNAEVWIRMKLYSTNIYFQIGVIHDQNKSWSAVVSDSDILKQRHSSYGDRISLHSSGYISHAGHDIEGSIDDEILDIALTYPTDSSNYHNRYGYTAGSGGKGGSGLWTVGSGYYYMKSDTDYYRSITQTTDIYYIGMKINYYEVILTGNVSNSSSIINNIQINGTQLTSLDNVYSGMYLTSDDFYFPGYAIIQSITYSGTTSLVMGDELDGSGIKTYGGTNSNITFKAFGQKLEFQYTNDTFNDPKNIGPNHIILPRKYKETPTTSTLNNINYWSFYIGDTTSTSNSGFFSIKENKPTNYKNIYDSFLEISNRVVDSNTYMGSTADYNGPYDVSETQVYLDGQYHLYIGVKVTTSPVYYSDISIAAVQILSSTNTVLQTWIFNSNANGWKTYTSQTVARVKQGFPVNPLTASSYNYVDIGTSTNVNRFSLTSQTGSNYTGTADGIATTSSAFSVGDGTISQSSGKNYLFRETSGSSIYTGTLMKSPSFEFTPGDKIRVVHMLAGYSSYRMDENDSLYLGAYKDLLGSFHSIALRTVDSDVYMGSTADYTGPYDVSDTVVGHTGSYRIYLGVKVTSSTTFYNDISIAAIQIVNSTGTTVKKLWNAAFTSGLEWQTYQSQTAAKTTKGFPITPQTASGYTYYNIGSSHEKGRFTYTSSTGSSYTGTQGGIDNPSGVIKNGISQISQVDTRNYFFRETSGSTRYTGTVMRSPSFNFTAGDRIRVVHLLAGYSSSKMDYNDSLYLGLY